MKAAWERWLRLCPMDALVIGLLATLVGALLLSGATSTAFAAKPDQTAKAAGAGEGDSDEDQDTGSADDRQPDDPDDALGSETPDKPVVSVPDKTTVTEDDRKALAKIGAELPAHGLTRSRAPAMDADDEAWRKYALKLVKRLVGRKRRKGLDTRVRPLAPVVRSFIPTHRRYRALQTYFRQLLEQLRAEDVTIPKMRYRIAAGTTSPEVAILRKRLLLEGYGDRTVTGRRTQYFDRRLRQALRQWQRDHGLGEVNEVDNATRWALNKHDRLVAKVALAMKRWRQHRFTSDAGRRVIVDINAGQLVAEQDGVEALRFRVIAGRATRADATPALSSRITRIVLNPPWRVPPRIARELKRKFGDDVEKARARGYRVKVNGEKWRVTKPAGSANPLGKIIFRMPGTRGIFLHDTNSKNLFERKTRTMSHGCVRLQKPLELAHWILPPELHNTVDKQFANGQTKHIRVPDPVATHLVYETLEINAEGFPVAVPDRYGRDAAALSKIDGNRLMKLRPPVIAAPVSGHRKQAAKDASPTTGPSQVGADKSGTSKNPVASDNSGSEKNGNSGYRLAVEVSPVTGGNSWRLDRYKGRLLVLMFVASWCTNCHLLAPKMKAAIDKLRAQGHDVALLGIGLEAGEQGAAAMAAYLRKHKFSFPVVMAGAELLSGATALGRIERLPVSWIVGRTGVPLYRHEGRGATVPLVADLKRYIAAEASTPAP